jgi:hypothetical protein
MDIVERLAERLFTTMDRLDPPQETIAWSNVPEHEKDFYRESIKAVLKEIRTIEGETVTFSNLELGEPGPRIIVEMPQQTRNKTEG